MIRDATCADIPQISAIWNPVIRDTIITFWPTERSDAEIAAILATRRKDGHGFFVADEGGTVVGFAGYSQFRGGAGYARALEHTVYAAPGQHGKGIGRALVAHLEHHARARGGRAMIGVVTAENTRSVAFHLACGYARWGYFPAVGWKFGRFHDAVFMGKDLAAAASAGG